MKPEIYLAPLSGVTDLSFRLISRELGAKFCFYEMVDANAMVYAHPNTHSLLKTTKDDAPIAAQLLGASPETMRDAAERLLALRKISFLDVNSACPAKKVLKKKAGAYLLKEPERLHDIIKTLASSIPLPITVKLRTGFSSRNSKELESIAKGCEDAGASKIFIHGRTCKQGYSGEVDYEAIRLVKNSVSVPVFGSGNVLDPYLAKKMLDLTGSDGILVARGAMGDPWIFKAIEEYLKTGHIPTEPDFRVKRKILKRHLSYVDKYKDIADINKVGFMGKIAAWYIRGVPRASKTRSLISKQKTYRKLLALINKVKP